MCPRRYFYTVLDVAGYCGQIIVEQEADTVTDSTVEVGAGADIRDCARVRGTRGRSSLAGVEEAGKEVRSGLSSGAVGGRVEVLEGDGEGVRMTSSLEGVVASVMIGLEVAMVCSATSATVGSAMIGLLMVTGPSLAVSGMIGLMIATGSSLAVSGMIESVMVTGSSLAVSGTGAGVGRMSTFAMVAWGIGVSGMMVSERIVAGTTVSVIVRSGIVVLRD
ncbi:hypothetical protein L873DRAFT_162386 [Choiromyces venosus 120613-1]|uniref:Uncharacterized protein n=1 Tax=Choiromyces venosus 120613-1 TaxID=1336337 RepID=A0A3N4K250_9PEZI|nr:hypothetical protein L873DRAFT_162386 [Choiromyces venosus 120613-1]